MKTLLRNKFFYFTLQIITLISLITGCNKEETLPEENQIKIEAYCKDFLKSTELSYEYSDTLSCIEYSYNDTNKILSITHINSGFNCAAGIYYNYTVSDTKIVVTEIEKLGGIAAPCQCLYDLEMTIKNVEKKEYQIKFVEPLIEENDTIYFDIDLQYEYTGTYCLTRKYYPWGQTYYE